MVSVNEALAPVVILDNYDSFTYNLYQMLQAQTERPVRVFRNDAITFDGLIAMKPDRVVLSPGPGHPDVPEDFGLCATVIRDHSLLRVPVLGVCLGHQGMVSHLGGKVIQAPNIMHGKTSKVSIEKASPLLEGLPNPFTAMRYHSLVAQESFMPDCLEVLAHDLTDSLVMAIQHKTLPLYGVQFHPESIGTPEGAGVLSNFLERC